MIEPKRRGAKRRAVIIPDPQHKNNSAIWKQKDHNDPLLAYYACSITLWVTQNFSNFF
jgi:hypothetical protein